MKHILPIVLLATCINANAQKKFSIKQFDLGVRSTLSMFEHDGSFGLGSGGQYRLKLLDRLNTEWYLDYITFNMKDVATRNTGHIGWSVFFYPFNTEGDIVPFFLTGHCFDHSKISSNNVYVASKTADGHDHSHPELAITTQGRKERWSSAVQAGLGCHIPLNDRSDLSITAQYMSHLGNQIAYHIDEIQGEEVLMFEDSHDHPWIEGHLLITLSLNYHAIKK